MITIRTIKYEHDKDWRTFWSTGKITDFTGETAAEAMKKVKHVKMNNDLMKYTSIEIVDVFRFISLDKLKGIGENGRTEHRTEQGL